MIRYGIYGYETTIHAEFDGFKIVPLNENHTDVASLSSDLDNYNLTGFLEINRDIIPDEKSLLFDLQGILSFIDQKNVIITNSLHEHEEYKNLDKDYPRKLTALRRLNGGGALILSDVFSPVSRKDFIGLSLDKLKNIDSNNGDFRGAFFKSIEVFRGSCSFIDVNYYLLFSALESLSRSHLNDFTSTNCSTPIANFLKPFGFDISQDNPQEFVKAVSTYTHLRNSLFHNGMLECEVNVNNHLVTLELSKYYSHFKMLIPLVMMKYIGFDDGHINWNCWLDGMAFK